VAVTLAVPKAEVAEDWVEVVEGRSAWVQVALAAVSSQRCVVERQGVDV